jgi:NAD(P)-dependent dehydrogenase (short-subunit alcohol dehydrogenase family)
MGTLLQDKVAVVTGSGRGIGRSIALAMADQGAKVVVNDVGAAVTGEGRDETPAQEVVRTITQQHGAGRAVVNTDSVADWQSAQNIVKTALDNFGRIDVVVNNAGILRDTIFHRMTPEEFDAVVKVHLYGAFYVSRAAIPQFRAQESGAFIHMTSTSGLIGSIGQVNYAAAKLGIAGLSRAIAGDTARYKVRSNCIGPHAFSRMIESIPGLSEDELAKRAARTSPDHVARLAVFLACDAAAEITGNIFGARGNELYLYSQPRPIRILMKEDGWTPEKMVEIALPAWRSGLTKLERTRDVYDWEAV